MNHCIAKLRHSRFAKNAFRGFLAGALALATSGIAAAQLDSDQNLKLRALLE